MPNILVSHPYDNNIKLLFRDTGLGYHIECNGTEMPSNPTHVIVDSQPATAIGSMDSALLASMKAVSVTNVPHVIVDSMPAVTVSPAAVPPPWMSNSLGAALATNAATVIAPAAGAGLSNYLDSMQLINASATVPTVVTILDGATTIWTGYLPCTVVGLNTLQAVPVPVVFQNPLKGSANTSLSIKLGTAGAAVYWSAQGHIQ